MDTPHDDSQSDEMNDDAGDSDGAGGFDDAADFDDAAAANNGNGADVVDGHAAPPRIVSAEAKRIAELERELEASQEKLRQYSLAVDRARGEFDGARLRLEREQTRVVAAQKVDAVSGILGVLDSLDQALNAVGDGGMGFVQGIVMIRNQFEAALRDLGLERFDAVGEIFDPQRHEAVSVELVDEPGQDGLVLRELKAGAQVGGKVVRPAAVVVGRLRPQSPPADA